MNAPNPYRIVFLCTGNICRSPMAEGILRGLLDPGLEVSVSSAGVAGLSGVPASDHSVTACAEEGYDIAAHRSRPLTAYLLEETDLVLAMEEHHRQAAMALAPHLTERIHLLSRFAAGDEEAPPMGVPDPIGGDLEEYRSVYRTILRYVREAQPRIEARIQAGAGEA